MNALRPPIHQLHQLIANSSVENFHAGGGTYATLAQLACQWAHKETIIQLHGL